MTDPRFLPHADYQRIPPDEMGRRAAEFYSLMRRRRTIRDFSPEPVPRAVLESCILAAGTAPNGANRQPWHFVVVTDPAVKTRIREAAEIEERDFY